MLFFLLGFATIQLAAACGCFASKQFKSGTALFLLGGCLSFCLSRMLLFQFFALALTGLVLRLICWALWVTPRYYWALGASISGAIFIAFGLQGPLEWSALRDRYPMESMADRLAYETSSPSSIEVRAAAADGGVFQELLPKGLTPAAVAELDQMYADAQWSRAQRRSKALSLIHASFLTQFVNSPGFGNDRSLRIDTAEKILARESFDIEKTLASLGQRGGSSPMYDDKSSSVAEAAQPDALSSGGISAFQSSASVLYPQLERTHHAAQIEFANLFGFGYIVDRQHVVGFQSHRMNRLPNPTDRPPASTLPQFNTRRIELVSLLKYRPPMVYLSKDLPTMEELRSREPRPLNAFEEEGLAALRAGGFIQLGETGNRIRMLGAIRAAKQCLSCHAVEHGALLGAFSYELEMHQPPDLHPQAAKTKPSEPAL